MAGADWLADGFATLLWPALVDRLDSYAVTSGGLGEGALCLWLLAVGVNGPKWREQAGAAAS